MAEFVLVRHGSTANLEAAAWQGWSPVPLSDLGVRQARAAAKRLALEGSVAEIISSPLQRALQTAKIITAEIGCEARELDELKEQMAPTSLWGVAHLASADYAGSMAAHGLDPDWSYEDGETLRSVSERVLQVLQFLREHAAGQARVVVVSHGITIRMIVAVAMVGEDGPIASWLRVFENIGGLACCAFARLLTDGHEFRLASWNDVGHLAAGETADRAMGI